MLKGLCRRALLVLAGGSMFVFGYGGCLDAMAQRVLVAVVFD